jgi:hypothetical protein
MKQRCLDLKDPEYKRYGGRGVKIDSKWIASFEAFYADVGPRPPDTTLDRYPDRDGDYTPGNVRWATHSEQQNNRRNARMVTFDGTTRSLNEWASLLGIKRETLATRLYKLKWPIERALNV